MNKTLIIFAFLIFVACADENPVPKPKGYFRIALPQQNYTSLEIDCPYAFDINENARWIEKRSCWGDIHYPDLNATLQLTYKEVNDSNLNRLLGEAHRLAYEHSVRADGIDENVIYDEKERTFGLFYDIKGDAATNAQFFVTDSSNHFLRGVLYFYAVPNADSLQPVNKFMNEEILHLVNTLKWQNS